MLSIADPNHNKNRNIIREKTFTVIRCSSKCTTTHSKCTKPPKSKCTQIKKKLVNCIKPSKRL